MVLFLCERLRNAADATPPPTQRQSASFFLLAFV